MKRLIDRVPESVGKPSRQNSYAGFIALLCVLLVVIILAVYMQVGSHQFLNFDDGTYVTNNPHVVNGISGENIVWAFTSVQAYNWHPVTWLSHMADAQLYGLNPRGHHLTNVAIHTISALILFLLLLRVTSALWQSLFVAALFALHPLHVESVAWVAERKDVLSAFFWFLTLFIYSGYVAEKKSSLYVLSLFFFVLGLMSKPMLVTLPLIMLLMDYWPLGRCQYGDQEPGKRWYSGRVISLVVEKIPFFACSLLSGLVTLYAQEMLGAISSLNVKPLPTRIGNSLIAYAKYISKTIWPDNLAVYYPFPSNIPLWQVVFSLFILLIISTAAIRGMRRIPYFAVGWFWFLITLLPVIGLVQMGGQSMADRYSYISVIGLFIMAAWGVPDLAKRLKQRQAILALLFGAVITASAILTWQQLGRWQNNISLYRHTLGVTTENDLIHNNLGAALYSVGDPDAAILEYHKALRINPGYTNARKNLGLALERKGYLDAALLEYREAMRISPNDKDVINLMERALARKKAAR